MTAASCPDHILPHRLIISVLFAAILASSLFFNGVDIIYFSISISLLLISLVYILTIRYQDGLPVKRSWFNLLLVSLFVWLGISVSWSTIPYMSSINFWWLSSLLMMYVLYGLFPGRQRLWPMLISVVIVAAVLLSGYGVVQAYLLDGTPQATFLNKNSLAAFLNLAILPGIAWLMLHLQRAPLNSKSSLLVLAIFMMTFTVAIIASRGAMLSLLISFSLLLGLVYKTLRWRSIIVPVLIIVIAFLMAQLLWDGNLSARIESLGDPASAGSDRFTIWRGAWDMLMASPWWGIGLGTFWQAYPAFRLPEDGSGGFYVHNDYLQLWIEAGLPALLLLIALMISLTWYVVRELKKQPDTGNRILLVSLYCAILSVSMHSFFTFNFYTLPILLIIGLYMAKLHQLTGADKPVLHIDIARHIGKHAYITILVLLSLFPISYLAGFGISDIYFKKAQSYAAQGNIQEASEALQYANQLFPATDNILYSHALLGRHILKGLPANIQTDRHQIYKEAMNLLAMAQKKNPLRPQVYLIRAQLLTENQTMSGPDWQQTAFNNLQRALSLNPRFYRARALYARLLLRAGRQQQAATILEAGSPYPYQETVEILEYYYLLAKLRQRRGNIDGAKHYVDKVNKILEQNAMPQRYSDMDRAIAGGAKTRENRLQLN